MTRSSAEEYEDIVISCFRFLGFDSLDRVNLLSFYEYDLLMTAFRLKLVDDDARLHKLALLIRNAKATNKKGDKYLYSSFRDFYDYDQELARVKGDARRHIDPSLVRLLLCSNR